MTEDLGGSARLDGGEAKLEPPHDLGGSARLDGGEAKLEPPHDLGGSARLDGGEAKLEPPHDLGGSARLDGGEAKLEPPREPGAITDAARAREAQLANRLTAAVAADEEFQAILRDAVHRNKGSRQRLDAIEAEIRQAATTWPGLDTPTGSRQFQQFLTAKTREIYRVVDDATKDSAHQSNLVRTLTSRYEAGGDASEGG